MTDPFAALGAAAAAAAAEGQRLQDVTDTLTQQVNALTAQHAADQATIAELEAEPHPAPTPQPTTRFPGDPGTGKIVVGAIVSGHAGNADAWEKTNGCKLGAHRAYWSKGIADFAPTGPIIAYCKTEHAAGRLPMVSGKLDWTQTTAGAYDKQLAAFRDAVEALGKPVDVIVNHEPENDGQPAAAYTAEQRHIRDVFGRSLTCLSFGGSLMAYDWAKASGRTPGDWWPGNASDGKPAWDWAGIDQYAQTAGNPIEDDKFKAALVSLKAWGVPPCFTELGIRVADAGGPAKLAQLFDDAIAARFVKFIYFDSDNNSTGVGWVLTGPLLAAFVKLCKDPRAVRPAA